MVTSAIILRRVNYAEYDYILDLLTRDHGKVTVIAKNAKKSKKRFAGVLELFSCLEVLLAVSRRGQGGMPLLKEAVLTHPFADIRTDVEKVAYASYWSEMINRWVVAGGRQEGLFDLFFHALTMLNAEQAPMETTSLLFQMRFMSLAGMPPELTACRVCRRPLADLPGPRLLFDVAMGGLLCRECRPKAGPALPVEISKSAVKQLLWLREGDLRKAGRIQLTAAAKQEGLAMMELFVPFHLATEIKSLKVLRGLREWRRKDYARKSEAAS